MKKLIILITSLLAISAVAIAGCNSNMADGTKSVPDKNFDLVAEDDTRGNDNNDGTDAIQPEPRSPKAERRTSDTDENRCDDGDCEDDDCPHCKPRAPHKRRKPHDGRCPEPGPAPAPAMPQN